MKTVNAVVFMIYFAAERKGNGIGSIVCDMVKRNAWMEVKDYSKRLWLLMIIQKR